MHSARDILPGVSLGSAEILSRFVYGRAWTMGSPGSQEGASVHPERA
jgi:hypothetical protein